jgi:hypothetical protein
MRDVNEKVILEYIENNQQLRNNNFENKSLKQEIESIKTHNEALINLTPAMADLQKVKSDSKLELDRINSSIQINKQSLLELQESGLNTYETGQKMESLTREINRQQLEKTKIEVQQLETLRAASERLDLEAIDIMVEQNKHDASIEQMTDEIERLQEYSKKIKTATLPTEIGLEKVIATADSSTKVILRNIENSKKTLNKLLISDGGPEVKQRIKQIRREIETQEMELKRTRIQNEIEIANAQEQSLLEAISEFKAMAHNINQISTIQKQIELANKEKVGDRKLAESLINYDSLQTRLKTIEQVKNKLESAFSSGLLSVNKYTQEIRQIDLQIYELRLQIANMGKAFTEQLEQPIDKITRKLETQKRIYESRIQILAQEKSLHDSIRNSINSRMAEELEISDKIKSSLEEVGIFSDKVLSIIQQRRLDIAARENQTTEEKFVFEEKSIDLARQLQLLDENITRAQINDKVEQAQSFLNDAIDAGNEFAIKAGNEKLQTAKEELTNLERQSETQKRIYESRIQTLAQEKSLHDSIRNSINSRMAEELEISDKIKSSLEEVGIFSDKVLSILQQRRLDIAARENQTTEEKFVFEEKSIDLARQPQLLDENITRAQIDDKVEQAQSFLNDAIDAGNESAIKAGNEKLQTAKEELTNLEQQSKVESGISSQKEEAIATDYDNQIITA